MTRRSWNVAWLVVALVVVALAAARYARVFGLPGILGSLLLAVVVIVAILRTVGPWWVISRPSPRPPEPRNVTPAEPPLASGPSPRSSAASAASSSTIRPRASTRPVVVIEPPETLESKLVTLDRLRADGRLTDAEYEAKRAQLLADF